jgi:all-trans-retinol dehydrogenase (NAD+)
MNLLYLIYSRLFEMQILKAFLPSMLEHNHGRIVTIASGAGLVGISNLVDYCSSTFAAVGLHEALTYK